MLTSSPGMSCEEELPPLPQAVCLKALDCTLKQAPGCFQWQLKRILERGGMGYVPTGLMGFKDRFCRGYKKPGASAEEAVDYWMHSCDDSTIRKVLLFANDKHNLKLVKAYHETLVEHLTNGHNCTEDPADCFHTCDRCPARRRCSTPVMQHRVRDPESWRHKRTQSLTCTVQFVIPSQSTSLPLPPSSSALKGNDTEFDPTSSDDEPPIPTGTPVPPHQVHLEDNCPPQVSPEPNAIYIVQPSHHGMQRRPLSQTLVQQPVATTVPTEPNGLEHFRTPPPTKKSTQHNGIPLFQKPVQPPATIRVNGPSTHPIETGPHIRRRLAQPEQQAEKVTMVPTGLTKPNGKPTHKPPNAEPPVPKHSHKYAPISPQLNASHDVQPSQQPQCNGRWTGSHTHRSTPTQLKQQAEKATTDPQPDESDYCLSTSQFLQTLNHHSTLKGAVLFLYLAIFVYHFLAMMLLTMCEDGGFQTIFDPRHNTYSMIVHRIVMFLLRIVGRIVTPGCCLAQLHKLASCQKLRLPRYSDSTNMEKMDVYSMLTVVFHTVVFMGLLLYLGAFFLAEEKIVMEGVCNLEVINSATVVLPWINVQILLTLLLESISIFLCILLVAITTEFYSYENRVAKSLIGSESSKNLHIVIRDRWIILDIYCYATPIVFLFFWLASYTTGIPFTPDPPRDIEAADFATWYFWVFILSALTLFASSRNTFFKRLCVIVHVFAVTFAVLISPINGISIEPICASIIVLLFMTVCSHAANILYCVQKYHYRCWRATKSRASFAGMAYCIFSIVLLAVLCLATGWREVNHLGQFVVTA